ncbi:complex I subunit 4 family protein [Haloferula sargassicola]|uniref:NAD(P)H-quinone oxidoreductase chain 4 1 n=1 Tax=Haloferula sargassicola TaxID=490096 RepID=A0ABP9UKG1_9BACT
MNTLPLLSLTLFLPLLGAVLALLSRQQPKRCHAIAVVISTVTLVLAVLAGLRGVGPGFTQIEEAAWIPSIGAAYRLGVDGFSYPLVLLTSVLFLGSFIFSAKIRDHPGSFVAVGLFLEMACLGVFLSLDLVLFYVFFELTLVGMYFVISKWGHEGRKKAALLFFLYTLVGSLFLLLGLLSLYLHSEPRTFDMRALIAAPPAIGGQLAALTFGALLLAFAIKTPLVPFHTWLPAAHTEAPAAGSAILAGILLKLGAYGFIRISLQMMPETFREHAWIVITLGVISAIYGALVALAQTDLKRMVAYTSVNHMGYLVFGVGIAALAAPQARGFALTGASLQMISHGIVTGMLFLLVGAVSDRTGGRREMPAMSGLLRSFPKLGGLFVFGSFASLGLPGLAHFPAEFQIFLGGFNVSPWAVAAILLGLVLTAALYLRAIQTAFMGEPNPGLLRRRDDLTARELWAIVPLAALTLAVGVFPGWITSLIHATAERLQF